MAGAYTTKMNSEKSNSHPKMWGRALVISLSFTFIGTLGNNASAADGPKGGKQAKPVKQAAATAWTAAQGWNGLVVGKDNLKRAEAKLGKLSNVELVQGEKCYNFKDAKVNIFVDQDKVINKIWVSGDLKDPLLMPKTVKQAVKVYGPLANKGPSGSGGDMYERPGISLLSNPKLSPEGITWMEFSKVER